MAHNLNFKRKRLIKSFEETRNKMLAKWNETKDIGFRRVAAFFTLLIDYEKNRR